MKKTVSKDILLIPKAAAALILVSVVIAFLYTMDWVGTHLFLFLSQLLGYVLYAGAALFLCRFVSKRIVIIALIVAVMMILLYLLTHPLTLTSFLLFLGKIGLFLVIIILFKNKQV